MQFFVKKIPFLAIKMLYIKIKLLKMRYFHPQLKHSGFCQIGFGKSNSFRYSPDYVKKAMEKAPIHLNIKLFLL